MSTVEKAFLKSKKDKSSDSSSASDLDFFANTHKKDTKKIVSSRKSISNMEQALKYDFDELAQRGLIHANMTDKKLLDHYRNLRTRLLARTEKDNFITMVTSVVPDERVTSVSANLAATIALDESKTSILIEANIAFPMLNSIFDLNEKGGLIDYLENDNAQVENYIHKTGIPRIRGIPSGNVRENASEYFTSDKMEEFVKELVSRYPDRYPIINAPSLFNSADARILLDLCDLVVLVVPYGACSNEDISKAVVTVGEEKLAGIILNNF